MATWSDVVAGARRTLQDYDADRHSDTDLLKHANHARRALAIASPKVYATRAVLTLAAGSVQSVPNDCSLFYGVLSNVGGNAVRVAEAEYLDALEPGWRNGSAGATVHFCYDEREPLKFDVYPPASAGAQVNINYSQTPADAAIGDSLSSNEEPLREALIDYTIARALLEDVESPVNLNRAMVHLQAFASATGANLQNLLRATGNAALVGGRTPKLATGQ